MENLKVKIINKSNHRLPEYKTNGASGMDLKANTSEPILIEGKSFDVIPTGLYVELPEGTELQIRSRSGLAANRGVFVLNAPGTIDSDYRGELKVILANYSNDPFLIRPGDRIAQAVVSRYEKVEWEAVRELEDTERGEDGLGSTGV